MNSTLRKSILILSLAFFVTLKGSAQTTVTIQPGYTNQTFYSMSNGTVSSVVNTDWDVAFQLRGFAASVLINSKNNVKLYNAQKSASQWSTIMPGDTTGIVGNPANQLLNSDTSWDFGAFNTTNNPADPFDLGWGNYDFNTHAVNGDSIYFMQLSDGSYRKFFIESLLGGIYTFKWANLDGSNELIRTLSKPAYQGKFFVYYSILNDIAIDREPAYNAWDLSFAQYLAVSPIIYKVTGVLANDSVEIAQAYPVDVNTVTSAGQTFSTEINTIGYDWKSYDFATNTWTIADSLVYFVTDRQGITWKMVFTGFDGSSTGNFYFNQTLAIQGLHENNLQSLGLYPNPARQSARLMINARNNADATVSIADINGRYLRTDAYSLHAGVQGIDLNLNNIQPGLYEVIVINGNERQVQRLVIQ